MLDSQSSELKYLIKIISDLFSDIIEVAASCCKTFIMSCDVKGYSTMLLLFQVIKRSSFSGTAISETI